MVSLHFAFIQNKVESNEIMYNQVTELLFAALIRSCYHICTGIPESLLFHSIPSIQFHPFHILSHKKNSATWFGLGMFWQSTRSVCLLKELINFRVETKNTLDGVYPAFGMWRK